MNNLSADQSLRQQLDCRKVSYLMIDRHRLLQERGILLPWSLEIQPTHQCNYKCLHCSYKERNDCPDELSAEIFYDLIQAVKWLSIKIVYISGGGEPLVKKYVRNGLIDLSKTGAQIVLVTNGSLLHKVSTESLSSLKYIQVSIPSVSRKTFHEITTVDCLDSILQLPTMVRSQCGSSSPQLTAMYVITSKNLETVYSAVSIIKDAGYDFLRFRLVEDYEGSGLKISEEQLIKLREQLDYAYSYIDFTNLYDVIRTAREPSEVYSKCNSLEMSLMLNIDPSGDVYCCNVDIGHKEMSIGNVHEQLLTSIWRGPQHLQRMEVLQSRYRCGGCSLSCRGHGYNNLFSSIQTSLPDWPTDQCPAV